MVCFVNIYPLDSDLSSGQRYPVFEQLGPGKRWQACLFLEVMAGLQPYRFEPERVPNPEDCDRLEGTIWCTCERCEIMPTQRECVCCREQPER